jgi:Putative Actinobacterial Holin-X, holin superfamily III
VAARDGETDGREGIVDLVRETVDGLRTLIVDHIKLARVELASDLKSYGQSVAVLAIAGGVLAIGYVFAWIAAGFALARLWGAPLAFTLVAALHLLCGAIAVGWAVAKMRRMRLMRDTVVEAKSSASALARPIQGRLEGRAT